MLGAALKTSAERLADLLLEQTKVLQTTAKLPFAVAIKFAGAQAGFGALWGRSELETEGQKALEALHQASLSPDFIDWFVPENIADTLIGLQMGYKQLSASPWGEFGEWLATTWNEATCSYIGPTLEERQDKSEPETTLYDLFMAYYTEGFSFRALLNKALGVRAALVQASADRLYPTPLPLQESGIRAGRSWTIHQYEKYAFSALAKRQGQTPNTGYCPFKLLWGDVNNTHTLICSEGNTRAIDYRLKENGIDLFFTLAQEVPGEARQKNREIIFFADKHEGLEVKIAGERAGTAFPLGELIQLSSMGCQFTLRFCLESGQGRFFGHVAQGNRPGQIGAFAEDRFTAFDWQIFLRTLERTPECCLRVELRCL